MIVHEFESAAAVAEAVADHVIAAATQRHLDIALTGGGLGTQVTDALVAALPRQKVVGLDCWWGDERWVDFDSSQRNDVNAAELESAGAVVHRAPSPASGVDLEEAAAKWAQTLPQHFDMVILGVGPDGHVASLFPGRHEIDATEIAIGVHSSPKPPSERLSLSLRTINNASEIVIIAAGEQKRAAVEGALLGDRDLPVGRVRGARLTELFADRAALASQQ